MYIIKLKKIQAPKRYVIAPQYERYTPTGVSLGLDPGVAVTIKDMQAKVTKAEDEACKKIHGIGIIEKMKLNHWYLGGFIEITEVPDDEPDKPAPKPEPKIEEVKEEVKEVKEEIKEEIKPKKKGRPKIIKKV